jgi:hypothetical protein
MAYVNGTVVKYDSKGAILSYIVKPVYFYGEVKRQDFTDGSYIL